MPRGKMTPKKMVAKMASGRGPAIGGYSEAKSSMRKPAKMRVDNMADTKPYKRPVKMADEAPMKGKKGGGLMIAIAIGKPKKKGMK